MKRHVLFAIIAFFPLNFLFSKFESIYSMYGGGESFATSCFDIDSSPGNYEPGTQNEDDEDDFTIDVLDCVIGDGLILDFNVLCCGEQVLIDNDFANTSFDAVNYQLLWALTAGSSTVASAADVAAAIQIFTPGADGHSFIFTNTCTGGVSDLASGLYSFTPFIANIAGQIDDRCEAYGGTVELYVLSEIVVSNVVLVCLAGGGYSVTFDVSGGAPGVIAGAGYIVTDGGATSVTDNGGGNYTVTYPAGVDYLITIENSVNGQNQTGCPVTLEGLEITLPEANDWQLSVCEEVEGGSQGSFDLTSAEANILGAGSGVVTGWYEDAGLTISITTPTAFVNTTNPQLVYAEVTDPVTNCSAVAEVTLTVNSLPVVDITAGGCGHFAPVVLDAGSGAGWSYNWQPGGETTQTINAVEGYYEVTVTDENGCENTSHTEVYDPISIIVHPQGCGDNDSLSITIEGGQPDHPGTAVLGTSYTMTSYEVTSNIDGVLGNADGSGNFTIGSLSEGLHTITVSYEQLDEAGNPTGVFCTEMVEVAIYGPLELTIDSGCGYNNVSYIVTGGYTQFDEDHQGGSDGAEYTVNLTNPDGTAVFDTNGNFVGPVNSTYPHSNTFTDIGNSFYDITVTDWTTGCEVTATVEVFDTLRAEYTITDCLTNDVQVTATGGYAGSSYIPLNGPSNYTFNWYTATPPPGNTVIDQTNTTGTFTGFGPGTYYVEVIDNNLNTTGDCSIIIEVIIEEPLQLLTEYFCEDGIVATGGTAPYTYTLYESDGTTVVGTNTTGVFPGTEGTYYLEVTDANGCTTALTEIECLTNFVCDLDSTHDPICIDGLSFEVELNLTGSGTYTIDDGVNPALTGQGSGIITIGALPNGPYSITITSEIDPTCTVTLTGDVDCFQCDLVVDQLAECIDDDLYTVTLTITGTGTFTVDDGVNPPLTGQGAGVIVLGPYPSGNYNITVTSEIDGTCSTIVVGGQDCSVFECVVNANITATCLDENIYELDIDLVGNGSFTIDDGINPPITGQFTGTITVGPFPNGPYNITITSEEDINCVIVLNGLIDCSTSSPCDISAIVETICGLDDNFALSVLLTGTSTYEIMDNLTGMVILSGQVAGNIGVGTFPSGPYDITITDENDPNCSLTLTGEETCTFENCDLTVETEFLCSEPFESTIINYTIAGTGTFTIDDGVNPPATGQGSGNYSLYFPSAGTVNYNITIIKESNPDCFEVIEGYNNCGECTSCDVSLGAHLYCNGDGTYMVELILDGTGVYDIAYADGFFHDMDSLTMGLAQGMTQSQFTLGPFSEENFITIGAQDQLSHACWASITLTNPCSACELDSYTEIVCNADGTFNVLLNIISIGNVEVESFSPGFSYDQPHIGPTIVDLGPFHFPYYDIWFYPTGAPNCLQDYYGFVNCDPCSSCDLDADISLVCLDQGSYEASVNISGSGIYSIHSNFHPTQTGLSAGSYVVGTFSNGLHSITIQDDNNPNCSQTFEGVNACSLLPPCDIDASLDIICETDDSYEIQINFHTPGSYDIYVNGLLWNFGTFTHPVSVFSVENGPYSIEIVDKENTSCTLLFEGSFFCSETLACDLVVTTTGYCLDDNSYEVVVTITGSGMYTLKGPFAYQMSNLTSGTYIIGPFSTNIGPQTIGFFNVLVEDESIPADCQQHISTSIDCLEPLPCDLEASVEVSCTEEGIIVFDITISGSGIYEIRNNLSEVLLEVPAGSYTLTSIEGSSNITIGDSANPSCHWSYTSQFGCPEFFVCDLTLSVVPFCNPDGSFSLNVSTTGTDEYDLIWGDNLVTMSNQLHIGSADSTLVIGPFVNGTYTMALATTIDPFPWEDCYRSLSGSFDCENDLGCNVYANVEMECNDLQNSAIISLYGSSTYTISTDFWQIEDITGQTELDSPIVIDGLLTLGNTITITDETNPDCSFTFGGNNLCSDYIPCDLFASVNVHCIDSFSYDLGVDIVGGATYDIYYNYSNSVFANVGAGSHILGPFSPLDFVIEVVEKGVPDGCRHIVRGSVPCFGETNCNVALSVDVICETDDSYFIVAEIEGTQNYEVIVNFGEPSILSEGIYLFGPFTEETYVVEVLSIVDPACYKRTTGYPNCLIYPPCDLNLSYNTSCKSESYDLRILIGGNDTYNILVDGGLFLNNIPSGTHDLFDLPTSSAIIEVRSTTNPNCFQRIGSDNFCNPDASCDLDIGSVSECLNEDGFMVEVSVEGSGIYDIFNGATTIVSGVGAGTYTIGPWSTGIYAIEVNQVGETDCSEIIYGFNNCEEDGCNFMVNAIAECKNYGVFEILLELNGPNVYSVDYGIGQLNGLIAGEYILGPFYGEVADLVIYDENEIECYQSLMLFSSCPVQKDCGLSELNIEVDCHQSDELFDLILTFSTENGGDEYEVGVNDQSYLVNSFGQSPKTVVVQDVEWAPQNSYFVVLIDTTGCTIGSEIGPGLCQGPTALELLDFRGEVLADKNRIIWQTLQEMNADYFTLSKSLDGINFQEIARIQAKGTNGSGAFYEFLDKEVSPTTYYRLSSMDLSGIEELHPEVVRLSRTNGAVQITPNPFDNLIRIRAKEKEDFRIQVYNNTGQLIHVDFMTTQTKLINTDNWPSGIYYVHLESETKTIELQKLIRQ